MSRLLLACGLTCLAACAPAPAHIQAEFDVAAAEDGRTIVWWLRLSGPQFTALVHRSSQEPSLLDVDGTVHNNVTMIIGAGLVEHGLTMCPPVYSTVAVLKDGTMQFTGKCRVPSEVQVSSGKLLMGATL